MAKEVQEIARRLILAGAVACSRDRASVTCSTGITRHAACRRRARGKTHGLHHAVRGSRTIAARCRLGSLAIAMPAFPRSRSAFASTAPRIAPVALSEPCSCYDSCGEAANNR